MLLDAITLTLRREDKEIFLFDRLTLTLPEGKTTAVMGSSGCGKTTLLRIIAGLQIPDSGRVRRESDDISFVFQEDRLFPWLTALENVNSVLSDRHETLLPAQQWLAKAELTEAAELYPDALSGGMRRRVALVRGLCRESGLLLLDEPFAGLDEALHERMLDLVAQERRGKTTLLATHDKKDLSICDYLLTLSDTPGKQPEWSRIR